MHTNDKGPGSVDWQQALGDDDGNAAPEIIPAPLWFDAVRGSRVPADWDDPVMREVRTDRLRTVAQSAGEAMSELLLRLPGERGLGRDVLAEGGSVMTCVDAMLSLHRALVVYRNSTLRSDGEAVARDTVAGSHGAGIAARALWALGELRELITREIQALPDPE
jgi:hypothetical protein